MAKCLSPVAFLKWLMTNDKLDAMPGSSLPSPETRPIGFLRWVFSPETLPQLDPPESEPTRISLLRFVLAPEVLPQSDSVISNARDNDENGRVTS